MTASVPSERLLVACLCAAWCGSCRDYLATFDALAARFGGDVGAGPGAGAGVDFAWIDIEDEADALGDPDIEDFPTLLICRGDVPLFLGPVTPQPQTAERLVLGALADDLLPLGDAVSVALTARARRVAAAPRAST